MIQDRTLPEIQCAQEYEVHNSWRCVCLCDVYPRRGSTSQYVELSSRWATTFFAKSHVPCSPLGHRPCRGHHHARYDGDSRPDLVSGAYWYENPGPTGGEWKRHQYRTVGILGEFVSDCGEWTFDVNHDGAPDIVTAGWMQNGLWW